MRLMLAAVLASCGLALAGAISPAYAAPMNCPPNCDRIPSSAWIDPMAIPLYPVYRWPGLAGVAVTANNPRFRFEEACSSPPATDDPRSYAVAARATVPQPDGQWQLQVQVLHWRGETWRGGQLASAVFDKAVAALRSCQLTSPLTSPSITTSSAVRMAAVVSGVLPGQVVLHEYLLVNPSNSTVVELAMWASSPPRVEWPSVADAQVLDAMNAPLCTAYIDSCR
ncbi:ATPase [Mycobacteriaceae bacterium 1482268.1]|nr:ATPase [Mycobacteriaceae bacterium 1482268.1]